LGLISGWGPKKKGKCHRFEPRKLKLQISEKLKKICFYFNLIFDSEVAKATAMHLLVKHHYRHKLRSGVITLLAKEVCAVKAHHQDFWNLS
jgi:hypothetical protein